MIKRVLIYDDKFELLITELCPENEGDNSFQGNRAIIRGIGEELYYIIDHDFLPS